MNNILIVSLLVILFILKYKMNEDLKENFSNFLFNDDFKWDRSNTRFYSGLVIFPLLFFHLLPFISKKNLNYFNLVGFIPIIIHKSVSNISSGFKLNLLFFSGIVIYLLYFGKTIFLMDIDNHFMEIIVSILVIIYLIYCFYYFWFSLYNNNIDLPTENNTIISDNEYDYENEYENDYENDYEIDENNNDYNEDNNDYDEEYDEEYEEEKINYIQKSSLKSICDEEMNNNNLYEKIENLNNLNSYFYNKNNSYYDLVNDKIMIIRQDCNLNDDITKEIENTLNANNN